MEEGRVLLLLLSSATESLLLVAGRPAADSLLLHNLLAAGRLDGGDGAKRRGVWLGVGPLLLVAGSRVGGRGATTSVERRGQGVAAALACACVHGSLGGFSPKRQKGPSPVSCSWEGQTL